MRMQGIKCPTTTDEVFRSHYEEILWTVGYLGVARPTMSDRDYLHEFYKICKHRGIWEKMAPTNTAWSWLCLNLRLCRNNIVKSERIEYKTPHTQINFDTMGTPNPHDPLQALYTQEVVAHMNHFIDSRRSDGRKTFRHVWEAITQDYSTDVIPVASSRVSQVRTALRTEAVRFDSMV